MLRYSCTMSLNDNELRGGAVFKDDGQIYTVISYEHIKIGRGGGTVKVKAKNIKTGSIVERGFPTGAKVDEADVEKKKVQYLYNDGESYNFMDPESYEQFSIASSVLGDQAKFLYEGLDIQLIIAEEEPVSIELPNTLIYTIAETGPGEKGNTVSNVFKEATLSNGFL
jgi:elongation factor P